MASGCEKTSGLATTVTSPGAVRPRFRERQVLRAADLEAQQSYLIAARRHHNIGQHGWGIVQGLEITNTPELVVQPGMAIDGYGRELIVTSPVTILTDVFIELEDTALDVWLVYQVTDVNVPQLGTWGCGPGKNTKTRQQATLRLMPAPRNEQRLPTDVPREPVEVPDADLPFLPQRIAPDDPAMEWPVYLGTIRMAAVAEFNPDSPRPYATLTGEMVTAPSGRARMQVGTELQSDTRRFAVTVADASGKLIERLGIDREGNTFITGNTTVRNAVDDPDTDLNYLRLGPARLLNFRPLAATPAAAAPWQIYRTSVKEGNAAIRQLRFEFFHPADKGEPTSYRFAVGTRDAAGVFSPCFSLSADCTLTIAGNLTIGGQLVEGPIQADPADPRFGALVAQVWAAGTKVGEVTATTGTIAGIVTNIGGAVMSGVTVDLSLDGVSVTTVVTDNAGRYVASLIPVGDYTISATATGFDPTTVNATLVAADVLNIPLVLSPTPPPPPARIQGRVTDANEDFVPGTTVEFRNQTSGALSQVVPDADGSFRSGPLTPGTYEVRISAPGFLTQIVTASLGQTLTITLEPEFIPG
jgi:Carboxypeptidase regulatory-like domain